MKSLRVFALALLLPVVTFAAAPTSFKGLVEYVVSIMNSAVGILIVLGVVIYFWGAAQQLLKKEEGNATQLRDFLIMGIVVLFVMVSVWGILEVLDNTFKSGAMTGGIGGSSSGPPPPASFE